MVDCKAFIKMVPMAWTEVNVQPHRSLVLEEVPPSELHLCAPTVLGYSFTAKKWGRFLTHNFADIIWRKNAFDHLVLSDQKKTLIKSVVFADRSGMVSDVVSSKAGGFIIILHGKPGTGKTLTAEAAAELAEKPLMVLSAAELGRHAVELEHNLRNIFEICKMWDAIMLIDESEVYLEARSIGNVERNAMVSAFLRVLEYHQQVVFLTTNHITRLDAAFKSRVSIAIKYPDLDKATQREIWGRFLKMAKVRIIEAQIRSPEKSSISTAELGKLADRKLNGRQVVVFTVF